MNSKIALFNLGCFIGSLITMSLVAGTYHLQKAVGRTDAEAYQGAVSILIACIGIGAILSFYSYLKSKG